MGKKSYFQRVTAAAQLYTEPLPGLPLVELAGDCRVLIERHQGVLEYDHSQVCVKVCFGVICVCGCMLELAQMSKSQLVITGEIHAVTLKRRQCE